MCDPSVSPALAGLTRGSSKTKRSMKQFFVTLLCTFALVACGGDDPKPTPDPTPDPDPTPTPTLSIAEQNLTRAITIADAAFNAYFTGSNMTMSQHYNPVTATRSGNGSIWMYTSAIEAVNAIMHGLVALKDDGKPELYNANFARFNTLLDKLYSGADYYKGSFSLVSYTQTKSWTVYAVDRVSGAGSANVEGRANVYDDQMWLVRELLEAYNITGEKRYLDKAEYLTEYVLDGWDCTLDANGNENGGIPWGPGYTSKHSCSNGPMVSPLVWLHELYKNKSDEVTYGYIDTDKSRKTRTQTKSEYYLKFAKAIYAWQKKYLLLSSGVYDDCMNSPTSGGGYPEYEVVGGVTYRKNTPLRDRIGPPITYNSGSMLSGAADLYRATNDNTYKTDLTALSTKSFEYFAKYGTTKAGYYTYDISGFRNWFNGVLMRAYVEANPYCTNTTAIGSFQKNLDYAYSNYLKNNLLPTNLLTGWDITSSNNKVEGLATFAFIAEYAVLARYEIEKN